MNFRSNISNAISSLGTKGRILFTLLALLLVISSLGLVYFFNRSFTAGVPSQGGTFIEGIVGTPRFINPVLVVSDADRDLTSLIYGGLVRKIDHNAFESDLAESWSISPDGKEYTFILRKDALFHDGSSVSASDVLYTINRVKDPLLKSPKRVNWEGILVEARDEHTVVFTLSEPYAGFLSLATIGILPSRIWEEVSPEQFPFSENNIHPIGTGPYKIKSIERNKSGIPVSYTLSTFKRYVGGKPYIKHITIRFYSNEQELVNAYSENKITAMAAINPLIALELESTHAETFNEPLPRVFGLFFNHNQVPLFLEKEIRQAISSAINKDRMVREIFGGYATAAHSPLPSTFGIVEDKDPFPFNKQIAEEILEKAGWKKNAETGIRTREKTKDKEGMELSFSIATSDTPELKRVAGFIKEDLEQIGMRVELKIYDIGTLNQDVIRARKYDALLFGETYTHDTDLFAFWHSSQRNDPGLNVALYANPSVDRALANITTIISKEARQETYTTVMTEIHKDIPAIFLYTPSFVYVSREEIGGFDLKRPITNPSDRFANVRSWYMNTERVWSIPSFFENK